MSKPSSITQPWFLLDQPWVYGDQAGTAILAGHEDPNQGMYVCDCADMGDEELTLEQAQAVAAHIVDLHNTWVADRSPVKICEKSRRIGVSNARLKAQD